MSEDDFYHKLKGFDSVKDIQFMLDEEYVVPHGFDNFADVMVYGIRKNLTLNNHDYKINDTIGINVHGIVYKG